MKDKSIFISVGVIIYIAMSGIDRFVYHMPQRKKKLLYPWIARKI